MPRSPDNLTLQHEKFCREYTLDYKGGPAAIRAGYSEKTARSQASALLTKPNIIARIRQIEEAKSRVARVTVEEVIAELAKFAFLDIKTQFQNVNESGVLLKPFEELDGTVLSSVNEKRGKDGDTWVEVRFHDKMKALELLGKHLGAFEDRGKPADPNVSVTMVDSNPDEL